MTIPTSSNYPAAFDDDTNLYQVHDALRLRLSEDYNPGDTEIHTEGSELVAAMMPSSGLITLTEQCSDLDRRAISFYYDSFDAITMMFSGLELLDGFEDVQKPKRITDVTVNVMAAHHNNIKEAVKAIQGFVGVKGTVDREPFGTTMEGRINFLRQLVIQPKAWFTADKRTGNVPLEVTFTDMSFRLGTDGNAGPIRVTWDFGDRSSPSVISLISTISVTDEVPDGAIDVLVQDTDAGTVKKTYYTAGIYDVTLTVENDFGKDTVVFPEFINARIKAPDPAVINFVENTSTQETTAGVPPNGPFQIFPKIRSPINTLIEIEIPTGENPATPGRSYGGELLDDAGQPLDPIAIYTWELGDDLDHPNNRTTKASFGIGGIYDLKLRADTQYGAYRITTYEDSLDIIENQNLWLWTFQTNSTVRSYEYGLISETFKLGTAPTLSVIRDDSFLDGVPNESHQKSEFRRNVGFAPRTLVNSGGNGSAMLYWATGRASTDPTTSEKIAVAEFTGFTGLYITRSSITRQWNWVNLNASGLSYFVFGAVPTHTPNTAFTNQVKQTYDLSALGVIEETMGPSNYLNGANELQQNVAIYDGSGSSTYGYYSVYRSTWKDSTGFITRNDGVGPFFRIKSFYRTEGVAGNYLTNIRKLQDVQGPTKLEGGLVAMNSGVYFLNNSGSVSRFDPTAATWATGGPGINSLLYRNLQDTTVSGFDDPSNTGLFTSDLDHRAYLSFDYSVNAFLKFNDVDLSFSTLGARPSGEQFLMGVY